MKLQVITFALLSVTTAMCRAQIPVVTPTIGETATPTPTNTSTPGSTPQGTPFIFSGSPTPSITPAQGQPSPAALDSMYQPPTGDPQEGTVLEWVPYQPSDGGVNGSGQWPVVVILHIGGYKSGDYYSSLNTAATDLQAAGFYTVVASYPLAPPNLINNQYQHDGTSRGIASGRPPQQTRAIEAVVSAARSDLHCYHGLVGVLGGSAGAGHAAFIALDQTNTGIAWPFWSSGARPNFVACLSGQYDYTEKMGDDDDVTLMFVKDLQNYTNTTVPIEQWNASPVAHASSNIIPMYFIRSENETGSPRLQQYYMWNALYHAGANPSLYRMWTIPDSPMHAFGYWNDPIKDMLPITVQNANFTVRERVIGFFKQYLQ
jgi:acetyl esterase/lipase